MQSVRFVLRTVCPRLINPYDLSTPNQGSPYNLSLYGLSKANQSKKAVCTICLPYDLSADHFFHPRIPKRPSKEWKTNVNCLPYNCGLKFVYFHPVPGVILGKTASSLQISRYLLSWKNLLKTPLWSNSNGLQPRPKSELHGNICFKEKIKFELKIFGCPSDEMCLDRVGFLDFPTKGWLNSRPYNLIDISGRSIRVSFQCEHFMLQTQTPLIWVTSFKSATFTLNSAEWYVQANSAYLRQSDHLKSIMDHTQNIFMACNPLWVN